MRETTAPRVNSDRMQIHPERASNVVASVLAAMHGLFGTPDKRIALHEPEFRGEEWTYVKECIDTGWVSSVGSYVDRFERDLAAFVGCKHAVATCNGTSALHICLILGGVEADDEVLIPALTFIATANAVSYIRAVPHFVDSETISLGVDAGRLERYLERVAQVIGGVCVNRATGRRIRALVVMHVFGHPSDLDALVEVARRWKLALVEDAAESLGSYYHGRHTGNFGCLAALSFNGNKVITTGGGGAVLTNDSELAKRAKHISTTARVAHEWNFLHDEVGYNYRMPNINAALGCAQLERLPSMLQRKRHLADRYGQAFAGIDGVRLLREPPGTSSNYWLNAIMLDNGLAARRDELLGTLNEAGFMSRPVWTLMHRLPMYHACPRMDLDVAERIEAQLVNLPSSPGLIASP